MLTSSPSPCSSLIRLMSEQQFPGIPNCGRCPPNGGSESTCVGYDAAVKPTTFVRRRTVDRPLHQLLSSAETVEDVVKGRDQLCHLPFRQCQAPACVQSVVGARPRSDVSVEISAQEILGDLDQEHGCDVARVEMPPGLLAPAPSRRLTALLMVGISLRGKLQSTASQGLQCVAWLSSCALCRRFGRRSAATLRLRHWNGIPGKMK